MNALVCDESFVTGLLAALRNMHRVLADQHRNLRSTETRLRERVKELQCLLYAVSQLVASVDKSVRW